MEQGLPHSTDVEYAIIDLTAPVRSLISEMDGLVEDLSYNIEGIVLHYNEFRHSSTNPNHVEPLVKNFLHSRYVKNPDDAYRLANHSLYTFYPNIADVLKSHSYQQGIIHAVKLHMTHDKRMVSCTVLMKVI